MKTILVPTDFSPPALKALQFALDIAIRTEASLLVCHIYEIPLAFSGDLIYTESEFNRVPTKEMMQFLAGVDHNTRANVGLKTLLIEGNVVNELSRIIKEQAIALVVMGTTGGSNFMERFIGSTTEAIIKRGLCPVVAIPAQANLKQVKNIVYASDFKSSEEIAMLQLLPLKELFGASLTVLHVKPEGQAELLELMEEAEIKHDLARNFPQVVIHYVEVENKDVAEGLSHYVKTHQTSLLAFTILHRPLWENIFHNSVTHQLLHHLNLPMLALPKTGRLLDLRNRNFIKPDLAVPNGEI